LVVSEEFLSHICKRNYASVFRVFALTFGKIESMTSKKSLRDNADSKGSRSISRTCAVLRMLGESGNEGASLIEVAKVTNLPKSSAHRYLLVLESEAFVERDRRTQRYRLGVDFVSHEPNPIERLIQRAHPLLESVRDKWNETANIGMLVGQSVVYLDIVESAKAVRLSARKGDKDSIHATALGKVIAAYLPEKEVRAILRRTGMPKLTSKSITKRDIFVAELENVRARGYAVDDRENEEEGRCVAVYVPGLSAPTAVSISGVASRFPMSKIFDAAETLHAIAEELTLAEVPPLRVPGQKRRTTKAG